MLAAMFNGNKNYIMKQLILLTSGLFFLTTFTFAQQKNLFQTDSILTNTLIFKNWKPINQGLFGKSNEIISDFSDPLMKNIKNITGHKKNNAFVSQMPIVEPKGNYPIMIAPIDSNNYYSLRIVKPN